MIWRRLLALMAIMVSVGTLTACLPASSPTTSPTPTAPLTQYQLAYRLLAKYPDFFWCDPDFWPIGRPEEPASVEQFPEIRANAVEFSAIMEHLGLQDKADYTADEKLSIYREHKKLNRAVEVRSSLGTPVPGTTPSASLYLFTLRVGEGEGQSIQGTITTSGKITETKREKSFNTCPICLAKGTLIDTPSGPVPVEQLQPGMAVWTTDDSGNRVVGSIIETHSTPVPLSFQVVTVRLNDGRTVTASPGHPTADLKALGDYRVGDILDGAQVASIERLTYDGEATYDLLPSGPTGLYWANGILLRSTGY